MIFWINCCNIAILLWLDPVRRKACLLSYEKHKYGCQRSLWRWQVHVGHHNYEVLWQLLCLTQFTWHNNINNLVSLIIKTKLRLSEWSWALPLPASPLAHGMAARRDADDMMVRRGGHDSRDGHEHTAPRRPSICFGLGRGRRAMWSSRTISWAAGCAWDFPYSACVCQERSRHHNGLINGFCCRPCLFL
jgi:hypothetical protein